MAEQFERFKRFEYRMNSNLVIQREGPAPRMDEATGEPESLAGRLLHKMGDKVTHESVKSKFSKKRRAQTVSDEPVRRRKTYLDLNKEENVLNVDINVGLNYVPRSSYTRNKYQELLTMMQKVLGDQPQSVLLSACDETLLALKAENLPEDRRAMVEDVLGPVSDELYYNLFHLSKELTDFTKPSDQDVGGDTLDDTGVAVIFDEDDNMESTEVVDNAEEQEENELDPQLGIRYVGGSEESANLEKEDELNINKIDAYWLQRELNLIYNDYNVAQATEKEVLSILNIEDVQECENKLVLLLKYENFDFVKLLMRNRYKIIYCTRLGQAQSQEEKNKIFDEMAKTTHGQLVMQELSLINLKKTKQQQLAHNLEKELLTMKTGHKVKGDDSKQKEHELENPDEIVMTKDEPVMPVSSTVSLQVVDLENLAIKDGAQHMTNMKVVLPEGTERVEHKSYDEVIIHPVQHMPKSNRKKVEKMPKWAQMAFRNTDSLNPVQSTVYETAFNSSENMLICAPTGSGKTNVAILTILNVFRKHLTPRKRESGGHGASEASSDPFDDLELSDCYFDKEFTVIYISPMKSLVLEQTQSFSLRFKEYGISVHELTGEMSMSRTQIQNTQVIVTTPEKWDVVTRKEGMLERVELVIIDEVHLLHDKRGSVIEALVARTFAHDKVTGLKTRMVGLSATLPNYEDIAKFLRAEKGLYYFGNHYRPVPLEQHYIGIKEKKALKQYNITNELTYEHVIKGVAEKQVLVFVHSRKETYRTSKMILEKIVNEDKLELFIKDVASREILTSESEHIKNANLKELLPFGIGIHHAGLARSDRKLVEDLFSDKHLQLLVSTATLSWGVNLPAGVVIIKGTQIYVPEQGSWDELCPLSVQQMMGRAGRPQYDTFGKGVIITSHEKLQYYLSLNNQQLPIESQLVAKLPEVLNAEVVLRNVTNLQQALKWIKTTYLYVRIQKNPLLYGFNPSSANDEGEESENTYNIDAEELDNHLLVLINSSFVFLEKNGLVKYERKSGMVTSTGLGVIASNYYLRPESIKIYSDSLRPNLTDSDLLNIFSCSIEFKYIPTREEEIIELQQLQQQIPIPCTNANLTATSTTNRVAGVGGNNKISILLQAYISRMNLDGYALVSEMGYITQNAPRILTALFVISIKRGWSSLSIKLFNFCKMVESQMWQLMLPLRHFKTIPNEVLTRLEKKDIAWTRYYDLNSVELGELCRNQKLGKSLHKFVHLVPKVNLQAYVQPLTSSRISVHLVVKRDFNWDTKHHGNYQKFLLIIEDPSEDKILYTQSILLYPPTTNATVSSSDLDGGDNDAKAGTAEEQDSPDDTNIYLTLPITEPRVYCYFIRVINDKWIGSETNVPIVFNKLILPSKQDKVTTLLDLQPIPATTLLKSIVTASGDGEEAADKENLLKYYIRSMGHKYFNNIQTQVFSSFYTTDENVLLSAPYGSGRFTCGELAILRTLVQFKEKATVVVVVPFENLLRKRLKRLKSRFGEVCTVRELTGDFKQDLQLVLGSTIVATTAKNYNHLLNRYKNKLIQNVNLLVFEGVEFITDELYGMDIELLLTQLRYYTTLYTNVTLTNGAEGSVKGSSRSRLVVLSSSLYNNLDICNWLGITTQFNFNNFVRQVPITVNLYTFDQIDPVTRQNSMITTINKLLKNKLKVLVVTTNTAYTKQLALLLDIHLSNRPNELESHGEDGTGRVPKGLESLQSKYKLMKQLRSVMYAYEGFNEEEIETAERVFASEPAYRVMIVTSQVLWNLNTKCPYVIVADVNSSYTNRPLLQNYYSQYDLQYVLSLTNVMATGGSHEEEHEEDLECVFLLENNKKEEVKRMLYDSVVVESNLELCIEDALNNEIVQGLIKTPQDAIDWLTWTFYYRRLTKNPNYYSLIATTPQHLSEHLSELIENTVYNLQNMGLISTSGDKEDEEIEEIVPVNLGYIASFYSIKCTTVELFAKNVKESISREQMLQIISNAQELSTVQRRPNEKIYKQYLSNLSLQQKILLLIKCHMDRSMLSSELFVDLHFILKNIGNLLYALVDVISSQGYLKPALLAMEMMQRIVQALTFTDSPLLQLPHADKEFVSKANGMKVNDIFDVIGMEDDDRNKLLEGFSKKQVIDIANFCNSVQILDINYKFNEKNVKQTQTVTLLINIAKEGNNDTINSPYFPVEKKEQWWIVVGDVSENKLHGIKRTSLNENNNIKLDFEAPQTKGKHTLTLYVISDSYVSTDYQFNLELNVS
ncbi:U5 small nuclear ribonucleoprotein-specific helicase [Theileria orientalis]|uniref:U5 small nuclear ribonucleoprotein-specific helicase n=1 Tax=Theileria orientalis TaxID=68886 RepID=A0A976M7K1_THEOR|nr:U5 small nuclear ribonucleoprotein-specific helicase [Theileria orientalis]